MKVRPLGPIGHCSARVRKLLQIEEEQALRWKVKVRRDPDGAKGARGRRWVVVPQFGVPGPFSSRPLSPLGYVSFHFSQETVSKGPGGVSIISSARGSKNLAPEAAADHDRYATREEAVLTVSAAEFDRYAGRASAVETSVGRTAAILSNISDDPAERREFWLKVHEHEREATPDRLVFYRNRMSANGWRSLAEDETLPDAVRRIASDMAVQSPKSAKRNGDAFLEVERGEGQRILAAASQLWHKGKSNHQPLRLPKGRNGRTQFRLTAEFPAGLDAASRLQIMKRFCDHLDQVGVMYTAAIHAPDEHNDERNDHLHIAYYDRPCSRMPSGLWDFEVKEKVEGQHGRSRYPHRQPKIAELARPPAGSNYREHRASVIYGLRERFADLCNEQLTAAGIGRLFDPRKYSEMGIGQHPTKPLGTKAAPLEAAGVPTPTGIANAEILWSYALEQARQAAEKRQAKRQQLQSAIGEAARRLDRAGHSGEASALRAIGREAASICALLDDHEPEIEEFRVTLQMAYARPQKVVDTCARILDALKNDRGTKSDRADRPLIMDRMAAADAFLTEIDDISLESMKTIEPILCEVEAKRERFEQLATEIAPFLERSNGLVDQPSQAASEVGDQIEQAAASISPTSSARQDLEQLLERILDDHVVRAPRASQPEYTVPGITREEYRLLTSPAFESLAQKRLAGIARIQTDRARVAAQLNREHGHDGLLALSATNHEARRALRHLTTYRDHPEIVGLQGVGRPHPQQEPVIVAPTPNLDLTARRGDEISLDGDEGGQSCAAQMTEADSTYTGSVEKPAWTPVGGMRHTVADTSRDDAIAAYAEFIRTGEEVKISLVDGVHRVDLDSVKGWERSASVFEDEDIVRKAIRDRAPVDVSMSRPQRERHLAADRERDRNRIIQQIELSPTRPVFRIGELWEVIGVTPDLLDLANDRPVHPQLHAAYLRSSQRWDGLEFRESQEISRRPAAIEEATLSREAVETVPQPLPDEWTLEQRYAYLHAGKVPGR